MIPSVHVLDDLQDGYIRLVHYVRCNGERIAPRGIPTREVRGDTIVLLDPTRALPIGIGRGINTAFAAAEALQLVGEFCDDEWLVKLNPNVAKFAEPGNGKFWGSYGRRAQGQITQAIKSLKTDRDSRQAQIVLWDPTLDNQPGKKDYPCTTAIQFLLRDDKLEAHVRMRSNDVWWGLAYDAFMFTQLQLSVCNALEVEPGPYYHQPVSLHLYDRDLEDVNKMHAPTGEFFHPAGFGVGGEDWWNICNRARIIQKGNGSLERETLSEAWYRETIQRRLKNVSN